jgi:hypothetical protein
VYKEEMVFKVLQVLILMYKEDKVFKEDKVYKVKLVQLREDKVYRVQQVQV